MVADPLIGAASQMDTKLLDLHFEWDPGFRFTHLDCWAINLNWTRIRNHAHGHASAKGIESQTGSVDTIISPWVNLVFELRAGASKRLATINNQLHHVKLNVLHGAFLDETQAFKY